MKFKLAICMFVLTAATLSYGQGFCCAKCSTSAPGCETLPVTHSCACILNGTSCRVCGTCFKDYGCVTCPPGCPCFAQKAAAQGPGSQAFQDAIKLVPDRTTNPWTTSKTLTDAIRVQSNTLATILVEEQRDKQLAVPMFLVSNGPNVLWSPLGHPHKGTSWKEDRNGDVWTITLLDPPLFPDDPATSPTKLVLNRDKWELYDKQNKLVANGLVESSNAGLSESNSGPQSADLKLVPDKTKNPWITSKTLNDTVRAYSNTLARLLEEEQQDKQRALPMFLVSNGPGVLWSTTDPKTNTSWKEDRNGDRWTITLLDAPLPPDPPTSPAKLVLDLDKWELYDKANNLVANGSIQ